MTTRDTFGRDLSLWLREEGEHRVPDHLAEVLVQSAATRQRPWWSSPERWLPVDTVAVGRPLNLRPLAIIAVVVGALLLAAVAAIWVASQRPSTFQLASNGRIFVIDGQTLKSYAAGGGTRRSPWTSRPAPPPRRSHRTADPSPTSWNPSSASTSWTSRTAPRRPIPLSGVVGVGGSGLLVA